MCVVSNIGTEYARTFPDRWPIVQPYIQQPLDPDSPVTPVTRQEFNAELVKLRKEIEELKKLLEAAKAYDEATGQPDCEMDEKVALIKQIAELVGVDLEDLFETET